MFGISGQGYDHSTGIFSPDGRIFAAEYAKKAVEQGEPSIGILVNDGVVLIAKKRTQPLQEPDSVEKISKIDEHIGVATSGFMADARRLIVEARVMAQSYWLTFEEQVPAEALSEHICDVKAQFTQGGGVRPYGVAMLIASVDHDGSPRLFLTYPVGTFWGYLAAVIGRGADRAGEVLAKKYKRTMKIPQAIALALDGLRAASDSELTADNIEIAKVLVKTGVFEKHSAEEREKAISPAE
jgi:proteasome alpha subunit